jgi:hypothetical protein
MQISDSSVLLQSKYQVGTDDLLRSTAFNCHIQVLGPVDKPMPGVLRPLLTGKGT